MYEYVRLRYSSCMTLLTVGEAAERLGVSDRHVRRLAEEGDMPARRLGESWFIDERALTRRVRRAPGTGRTWAPQTAWAAVDLLTGGNGRALLDQPRISRLRSRLRTLTAPEMHRLAENRAQPHRFHASPRARVKLADVLVASGVSALEQQDLARRFGLAPVEGSQRVEGYLLGDFEALQSRLRLDPSAEGEVVIRHVPVHVDPSALLGTETVVALDLMDSDDVRERAAGREVLDRLLHRV